MPAKKKKVSPVAKAKPAPEVKPAPAKRTPPRPSARAAPAAPEDAAAEQRLAQTCRNIASLGDVLAASGGKRARGSEDIGAALAGLEAGYRKLLRPS